jgi:hypothetical protein
MSKDVIIEVLLVLEVLDALLEVSIDEPYLNSNIKAEMLIP